MRYFALWEMGFIATYVVVQKLFGSDLTALVEGDYIKLEKQLKAYRQMNPKFKGVPTDFFIEALRKHGIGFAFLQKNPHLSDIILNNPILGKRKAPIYDKSDIRAIRMFFEEYLEPDLVNCCGICFTNDRFESINYLLYYRDLLPETILPLIIFKTEGKLDYYLAIADKIVAKPKLVPESFGRLITNLQTRSLTLKHQRLYNLTTSYALKSIGRSGLVNFFYVMGNGISWMGREATTVEERIEKQEVLKDFRFMGIILLIICALFVGTVFYTNAQRKERKENVAEREENNFQRSVYGYLTDFDTATASKISYLKLPSGEMRSAYFKDNSEYSSFTMNSMVVNNSTYGLIILPDDAMYQSFGIRKKNYYIKPNDSSSCGLFLDRFYIGKELALFEDTSKDKAIDKYHKHYTEEGLPRFLNPIPSAESVIKKRFEIRHNRIELKEENGLLIVQGEKPFRVNNSRTDRMVLDTISAVRDSLE